MQTYETLVYEFHHRAIALSFWRTFKLAFLTVAVLRSLHYFCPTGLRIRRNVTTVKVKGDRRCGKKKKNRISKKPYKRLHGEFHFF